MIKYPLERAYRLLAQGLEKNDKNEIRMATEMIANHTTIGDDSMLGFELLPYDNHRVELSLEVNTRTYNEWNAAVAEAVEVLSMLRV